MCKILRGTKYISIEQTHKLKLYFGSFHDSCMNKALNLIKDIEILTELEIINWAPLDLPPKDGDHMDKPFGHNIQFYPVFDAAAAFCDDSDSDDEPSGKSVTNNLFSGFVS